MMRLLGMSRSILHWSNQLARWSSVRHIITALPDEKLLGRRQACGARDPVSPDEIDQAVELLLELRRAGQRWSARRPPSDGHRRLALLAQTMASMDRV